MILYCRSLVAAIELHVMSSFGTRARSELYSIKNCDIIEGPPRQDGVFSYLSYAERLTKTRRGAHGQGLCLIYYNFYQINLGKYQYSFILSEQLFHLADHNFHVCRS